MGPGAIFKNERNVLASLGWKHVFCPWVKTCGMETCGKKHVFRNMFLETTMYFTRSANNMVFYQWGDLQAAKHLALFWTNATE